MSEVHPEISEMIALCEAVLDEQGEKESQSSGLSRNLVSAGITGAIALEFESHYHVINHRGMSFGLEYPLPLSSLILKDPEMRLYMEDDEDEPVNVLTLGDVTVGYIDTILDTTSDLVGDQYSGPHLKGMVNTATCDTGQVPPDVYLFVAPLKLVQVSDRHIPNEFN